MSVDPHIERIRRECAHRRVAIVVLCSLPLAVAVSVLALRVGGIAAMTTVATVALGVVAFALLRAWSGVDAGWLARKLDASVPAMDDSAALLFGDAFALTPLQTLQRARLRARVARVGVELRPQWPWRKVVAAFAAALLILAAAALWRAQTQPAVDTSAVAKTQAGKSTVLVQTRLDIEAPAYTQIAPRRETTLEAKAPEGSTMRWNLRFDPQPDTATLVFHDGSRTAMTHSGEDWTATRTLSASTLYRVVLEGASALADDRLYRLDAIADRAPEVRVLQPEKTLSLLDAQQKTWDLAFEASDDYGIARADLTITLAQGTGENITFKEQSVALTAAAIAAITPSSVTQARVDAGPHVAARYRHVLDLAALGLAQGDDVVVRLAVTDNREPKPNVTRSASFILRWPVDASSESAGMEGIVQKTMPAYFRSQRQIIIDTEALIADKAQLDEEKLLARSDAIGVDQKILRLRYGQFLGEESESHAEHDDSQPRAAAAGRSFSETVHDGKAEAQVDALAAAHAAHERSTPAAPAKFGQEGNTVAEYGHVHDIAEAATLLDADTKATLKSALAEMWQSELNLRQGKPDEALPYEHRALEFIKQVQQSTRIYLARVGLELPAPDEARRLSGDRKGVTDRVGTLAPGTNDAATIDQLRRALAAGATPDWDGSEAWIRARESTLPDALGVLAAIDRVRRDPACEACRQQLDNLLWPLLPVPAAAGTSRTAPDAAGRAYLDALHATTSAPAQTAGAR